MYVYIFCKDTALVSFLGLMSVYNIVNKGSKAYLCPIFFSDSISTALILFRITGK